MEILKEVNLNRISLKTLSVWLGREEKGLKGTVNKYLGYLKKFGPVEKEEYTYLNRPCYQYHLTPKQVIFLVSTISNNYELKVDVISKVMEHIGDPKPDCTSCSFMMKIAGIAKDALQEEEVVVLKQNEVERTSPKQEYDLAFINKLNKI